MKSSRSVPVNASNHNHGVGEAFPVFDEIWVTIETGHRATAVAGNQISGIRSFMMPMKMEFHAACLECIAEGTFRRNGSTKMPYEELLMNAAVDDRTTSCSLQSKTIPYR